MKIRILEGQLESAKEEQSLALQKSLMQKSTFEATMSEAIENIREDHQEELLKREETIKNQFKAPLWDFMYDFDVWDLKFENVFFLIFTTVEETNERSGRKGEAGEWDGWDATGWGCQTEGSRGQSQKNARKSRERGEFMYFTS